MNSLKNRSNGNPSSSIFISVNGVLITTSLYSKLKAQFYKRFSNRWCNRSKSQIPSLGIINVPIVKIICQIISFFLELQFSVQSLTAKAMTSLLHHNHAFVLFLASSLDFPSGEQYTCNVSPTNVL